MYVDAHTSTLKYLLASPRAACCRIASTRFRTRPLRFSYLDVSIEAALRRTDLPGFASGFSIHQDDLPVPSFCTRMNRLCSDRLCLIEFCNETQEMVEMKIYCSPSEKERKMNKLQINNRQPRKAPWNR